MKVCRSVAFDSTPTIIPTESPLEQLNGSDYNTLWYQASDLDNFRNEARDLCRQMRVDSSFRVPDVRGLEQRSNMERLRRKFLAIKCIVRAQPKLDAPGLAAFSVRCTAWAARLASEEAARDYFEAHEVEETCMKRPLPTTDDDVTVNENAIRRVRARIVVIEVE